MHRGASLEERRPAERAQLAHGAAWAAVLIVALPLLCLVGFVLAIGAERATPTPSALHLLINRAVVGVALAAAVWEGVAAVPNRRRRPRAAAVLAAATLALGLLSIAFVAQQG